MAATCFKSEASAFRADQFHTGIRANTWDVSFARMNGELASSFIRADGHPSQLEVSARVEGGTLCLLVAQNNRKLEIPSGETIVKLDDFDDGKILIRIVCENATGGKIRITT